MEQIDSGIFKEFSLKKVLNQLNMLTHKKALTANKKNLA